MLSAFRSSVARRACVLWCILACAAALGCGDRAGATLARLLQARDLTTELSLALTDAVTAANRAVMAEADDKAKKFAQDAEHETDAVERDRARLTKLLQGLDYTDELKLLDTFKASFARYRELDREVLQLAVESSNLKAQKLSFGLAAQAVDAMRAALARAADAAAAPSGGCWQLRALLWKAAADVRELQSLEPPHIAAAEDAVMTGLEQRMTALETSARTALQEANPVSAGTATAQAELGVAQTELERFLAVHREILALSRRNSNVHSLELALGQHRLLALECQGTLRALAEELQKRGFRATR